MGGRKVFGDRFGGGGASVGASLEAECLMASRSR